MGSCVRSDLFSSKVERTIVYPNPRGKKGKARVLGRTRWVSIRSQSTIEIIGDSMPLLAQPIVKYGAQVHAKKKNGHALLLRDCFQRQIMSH